MLREIRWAYQRIVRGYDDRIFWGFDGYFQTMVPPLKRFCLSYLKDEERCRLNPERTKVFNQTVFLIEKMEKEIYEDMFDNTYLTKLATYFGKNIGFYWD